MSIQWCYYWGLHWYFPHGQWLFVPLCKFTGVWILSTIYIYWYIIKEYVNIEPLMLWISSRLNKNRLFLLLLWECGVMHFPVLMALSLALLESQCPCRALSTEFSSGCRLSYTGKRAGLSLRLFDPLLLLTDQVARQI